MPPRRKPRQRKNVAPASRVRNIKSIEQWENALEKAGTKRIVIAQFFQARVWTCQQLRPMFSRYSALPSFRKAIFLEIDVDEHSVGDAYVY